MDFSISDLNFNSVKTLPGFEARAASLSTQLRFFEKRLTRSRNLTIQSYLFLGVGVSEKIQIHSTLIIIISGL